MFSPFPRASQEPPQEKEEKNVFHQLQQSVKKGRQTAETDGAICLPTDLLSSYPPTGRPEKKFPVQSEPILAHGARLSLSLLLLPPPCDTLDTPVHSSHTPDSTREKSFGRNETDSTAAKRRRPSGPTGNGNGGCARIRRRTHEITESSAAVVIFRVAAKNYT